MKEIRSEEIENSKGFIIRFDGKHAFLSNFYEFPVRVYGKVFPSAENAYQSQKCPSRSDEFLNIPPGKAKRLGRKVEIDPDWESRKDEVMYEVVLAKFTQSKHLRKKLSDTGEKTLIEGNNWGDTYWGMCRGGGQNKLGKILEKVRDHINEEV